MTNITNHTSNNPNNGHKRFSNSQLYQNKRKSQVLIAAQSLDQELQNVKHLKRISIGSIDGSVDPDLEYVINTNNNDNDHFYTNVATNSTINENIKDSAQTKQSPLVSKSIPNNSAGYRFKGEENNTPAISGKNEHCLSELNEEKKGYEDDDEDDDDDDDATVLNKTGTEYLGNNNYYNESHHINRSLSSSAMVPKRSSHRKISGSRSISSGLNSRNNSINELGKKEIQSLLWVPASQHPNVKPENYLELVQDKLQTLSVEDEQSKKKPQTNNNAYSLSRTPSRLRKSYTEEDLEEALEQNKANSNDNDDANTSLTSTESSFGESPIRIISLKQITDELTRLSNNAGIIGTDAASLARSLSMTATGEFYNNDTSSITENEHAGIDVNKQGQDKKKVSDKNHQIIHGDEELKKGSMAPASPSPSQREQEETEVGEKRQEQKETEKGNDRKENKSENEEEEVYASNIMGKHSISIPQRSVLRRSKFTTYRKKSLTKNNLDNQNKLAVSVTASGDEGNGSDSGNSNHTVSREKEDEINEEEDDDMISMVTAKDMEEDFEKINASKRNSQVLLTHKENKTKIDDDGGINLEGENMNLDQSKIEHNKRKINWLGKVKDNSTSDNNYEDQRIYTEKEHLENVNHSRNRNYAISSSSHNNESDIDSVHSTSSGRSSMENKRHVTVRRKHAQHDIAQQQQQQQQHHHHHHHHRHHHQQHHDEPTHTQSQVKPYHKSQHQNASTNSMPATGPSFGKHTDEKRADNSHDTHHVKDDNNYSDHHNNTNNNNNNKSGTNVSNPSISKHQFRSSSKKSNKFMDIIKKHIHENKRKLSGSSTTQPLLSSDRTHAHSHSNNIVDNTQVPTGEQQQTVQNTTIPEKKDDDFKDKDGLQPAVTLISNSNNNKHSSTDVNSQIHIEYRELSDEDTNSLNSFSNTVNMSSNEDTTTESPDNNDKISSDNTAIGETATTDLPTNNDSTTDIEKQSIVPPLPARKLIFEDVIRPERPNSPMQYRDSSFGFPLPPLTVSTVIMFDQRLPISMERAIYRLSHMKLSDSKRELRQQVLLSNFMYAYLNLVNHSLYLQKIEEEKQENVQSV